MTTMDPIVRTVYNILTRYGGPCTVNIATEGEYDPETSTAVETTTQYTAQSIAFDYLQRMQGTAFQPNTLIRSGDKQFFVKMPAGAPLPNPGTDSVVYNGKTFNIITVKDYNPSGTYSFLLEMFIRE